MILCFVLLSLPQLFESRDEHLTQRNQECGLCHGNISALSYMGFPVLNIDCYFPKEVDIRHSVT